MRKPKFLKRRRLDLNTARLHLNAHQGMNFLAELHEELLRTPVTSAAIDLDVIGLSGLDIEFVLRQRCYSRIIDGGRLNRQLLRGHSLVKPVVVGVPRSWLQVIGRRGVRLGVVRSRLLWNFRVCSAFARGLMKVSLTTIRCLLPSERARSQGSFGDYVFFHDLGPENLPIGRSDQPATDIISWFETKTCHIQPGSLIACSIKSTVKQTHQHRCIADSLQPLAMPTALADLQEFLKLSAKVALMALVQWRRGNAELALLLGQLSDVCLIRATGQRGQARLHLFNSSSAGVRPLWTIAARDCGIQSICYHYSANMETLRNSELWSERTPDRYVRLFWWDEQFVWDKRHEEFLRSQSERPESFRVCGPISFVATRARMEATPTDFVAVFDVTPLNDEWLALNTENPYYTVEVAREFLTQAYGAISGLGLRMVWKLKRPPNRRRHHPSYLEFADFVSRLPMATLVDPAVGAEQLISKSLATVSVPFTSTALTASAMGKPSAFFDPSGEVRIEHPARRSMPLFHTQLDLASWLIQEVGRET